jgi:uncharacterized protein (TIGR02145 family)
MNARIIIMLFFPFFAIAQAPQKINFQSILRNNSGEIVANKAVNLQISVLAGSANGSNVFSETHAKTTDASGLISIEIGMGTLVSGVFNSINWGNLAHFIKLEVDFNGGTTYELLGTQELMSVPYALYASKTDTSTLNLTSRLATKLNATDTASLSNRIDAKAPLANPAFTGTVTGVTKTMVDLGNVDNTSDLNKPVSTATQTALDLKENASNKSDASLGTSTILYPTQNAVKTYVDLQVSTGAPDATSSVKGKIQLTGELGGTASSPTVPGLALKAPLSNPAFTGTVTGVTKTMVDLGNVDNTSDLNKPLSTATQTALDLKENASNKSDASLGTSTILYPTQNAVKTYVDLQVSTGAPDATSSVKGKIQLTGELGGTASSPTVPGLALKAPLSNPAFTGTVTGVTKTMVDLGNVDNTSDLNKPVSTATQTALDLKENASNKSDASLGTSTILYPTQNAVKTYVDLQVSTGAPDATSSVKGKIQLTGELGGTASSPTVPGLALKAPLSNPAFTGTVTGVTKTMVDLGNVDNTSDLNKPVSTATQTALDLKLNRSDFPSGSNTGNILYWNGTGWVNLAPGQNGQALILVNGIPSWSTLSTTVTVTDIDGNIYNTVQIGNQVWMSENLKTTRYRNGGQIPNVTDNTAWGNLSTGAWSYYNNDVSNDPIYGKLYNWYTTLGDTLCPTGWGVPTDAEWTTLTTYLGGSDVAGSKMKTIGNGYWNDPNTGAINSSGFSVLPGGYRSNVGSFNGIRSSLSSGVLPSTAATAPGSAS